MSYQWQEKAIDAFFSAVDDLKQLGVVRSGKYLGDIAEFLCCNFLKMELAESKKQRVTTASFKASDVK